MNIKELTEKKNANIERMEEIKDIIEKESRALTDEEQREWDSLKSDNASINKSIEILDEKFDTESRSAENSDGVTPEERAFADFIRTGKLETREIGQGNSGAIVPSTIANRIIEKVSEICPIYSLATVYNIKGALDIPVYDESEGGITAAYSEEFAELTEHSGKFTTVKLVDNIVGTLTKISRSLINASDFDVLTFVVDKVAKSISDFIEKEAISANGDKAKGVITTTNALETNAASGISVDDMIDVQLAVPEVYQANAVWVMNKKTLGNIRKLQTADGYQIFAQDRLTSDMGYSILGKPVILTDSMPDMTAGNVGIVYGDLSGLAIKMGKNIEVQILNEKYATQYATGIVAYAEFDAKVTDNQKIAALKLKAE